MTDKLKKIRQCERQLTPDLCNLNNFKGHGSVYSEK